MFALSRSVVPRGVLSRTGAFFFREMGTKAAAKSCVKPGATLLIDGSLVRVDRITQGGKARAGVFFLFNFPTLS